MPNTISIPDQYEKFVAQVVAALVGVEVRQGKIYTGRLSGRRIKVDVSFVQHIAGGAEIVTLVECKHYKRKVPVDEVEEFHSKVDDIGAHKGIVITTVGFQAGAIKTAKGRGIALALLTTEPQAGEIRYIVAHAGKRELPPSRWENPGFFQGNIQGILGAPPGGLRFESGGGLIGMLLVEAMAAAKT